MDLNSDESRVPLFKRVAQIIDGKSAPPRAVPSSDIPPELIGHPRYQVLERLGEGGMGTVFKARHTLMDRVVALKVMQPSLTANPKAAARFLKEVRAAAQLTHPNIVAAYDAEQVGPVHFLAMELVPGQDLAALVRDKGPLPVSLACDYVRQAALGLHHAHERRMVHRDVKPHNLILTPQGQVKILDFGLARFLSESRPEAIAGPNPSAPGLTQHGVVMGSPDYMAPEQGDDAHRADIRADIYSLGCTLYHLLAGHAPFPDGSTLAKLSAHRDKTARPLAEIRPGVPPKLSALVERMLAKDPAARPQTPAEVARGLTPFCGDQRIQTSPKPLPAPVAHVAKARMAESSPRPITRSKWFWAAIALTLVALVGSITTAIVLATRPGERSADAKTNDDPKPIPVALPESKPVVPPVETPPRRHPIPSLPKPIGQSAPRLPSVAEFLSKREVLTVAQDGSGQFKTIQQALDRLKSGQAILLKDKGPYRESPNKKFPGNTALISQVGTRVEITEYSLQSFSSYIGVSMEVEPGGLLLHGIQFIAAGTKPKEAKRASAFVNFRTTGELVIENCTFSGAEFLNSLSCFHFAFRNAASQITIQECILDGVQIAGLDRDSSAILQRNWVKDAPATRADPLRNSRSNVVIGASNGMVLIRHNVIEAGGAPISLLNITGLLSDHLVTGDFVIHNNVLLGGKPGAVALQDAPGPKERMPNAIHIANNIFHSKESSGIQLPWAFKARIAKVCYFEPNVYARAPEGMFNLEPWPMTARDKIAARPFLSDDPEHPDYLRVARDGPLATGAAGDDLPGYFGAFPPGPAPKEGDWFTRFRQLDR